MENNEKGEIYELYIADFLKTLDENKEVFVWYNIPEKILFDAGLIHCYNEHRIERLKYKDDPINYKNPLRDVGVDVLACKKDGEFELVQCKNGYNKGLLISDLSGFYMMALNHPTHIATVYYTSKLSVHIRENAINPRIRYFKKVMNEQKIVIPNKVYKLFSYQKDALNALNKHFENNHRGILTIPCGLGKTFISSKFAENYQFIFFLSPLKQFAQQTIDKYENYDNTLKSILVDGEGTRNLEKISNFIKKNRNSRILFSATYKSTDIINKIIDFINLEFIEEDIKIITIIDEYHNLSINNLTNEEDEIFQLLTSPNKYKIVFMSATPRVYELENSEYEDQKFDDMLGKIVYKMSFSEAIENKYCKDYEIIFPSVSEDKTILLNDLEKELKTRKINFKELNHNMKLKILFLLKGITFYGSKKTIVYLRSHKEIYEFIDMLKIVNNNFYGLDINIDYIISTTKHFLRQEKLEKFTKTTNFAILCSVEILDECIDIPSCDSIFISYASTSKIRTVQRMSRCLRNDDKNINKKGYIYAWCDEYSEILEILSGIKEYDPEFRTKIKSLQSSLRQTKKSEKELEGDKKLLDKYVVNVQEYKISTWENIYEKIKTKFEKNEKIADKKLINWCRLQRSNYKNNFLSKEKIKLLSNVKNWWWEKNREEEWIEMRNSVSRYMENNITFSKTCKNNFFIKKIEWCYTQKKNYKNGILSEKRIKSLEKIINWTWKTSKYEKWFEIFQEIKKDFNEMNIPSKHSKSLDIKKKGMWCASQRKEFKKNKLSEEKIKLLETINGWWWNNKHEKEWNSMFDLALKFFLKNPSKKLIIWCRYQRTLYKKRKLTNKKIEMLETIEGWYW